MVKFDETGSKHLGFLITEIANRNPLALAAIEWVDEATDPNKAIPPLPFDNNTAKFVAVFADFAVEVIDLLVDRPLNHEKLRNLVGPNSSK